MPAKPQTQDGLKSKGSRLQGFSRINSDTDANYNAAAPKQALVPARSDTPAATQDTRAAPTREEIAKDARVKISTRPQKQVHGPPLAWGFPKETTRNSPVKPKPEPAPQVLPQQQAEVFAEDEDATNRALFDGSQLGDDFMNSRITTPRNEPEEYNDDYERQKPSEQPLQPINRGPSPQLGHEIVHYRRPQPTNNVRFQMTDGSFRVSNQLKDHRRERSQVRDGFSNEPLQERQRQWGDRYTPASPAKPTQDLPYRGVKIKPQKKKENRPKKQQPQELSPYDHFARQPAKSFFAGAGEVIELEDDGQPIADAAHEETPKQPRRIRKQPQDALMESALPPPTMNWNKTQHSRKRNRASLDYDDKVLSEKTFDELLNEPFDHDPARAGDDQGGDGNPLSNKLDRFLHQSEGDQRAFFASMKIEQWEESGDWLVDRFADLMKRTREARREKRKVVAEFEKEAGQREEAVRLRSDGLDRKMEKMKENGRRVVGERQAQATVNPGRRGN